MTEDIRVLYEDESVLAVNKPPGVSVHGDGVRRAKTVSDWVVKYAPKTKDVGEPLHLSDGRVIPRHGIVHRLDKETSGVMILAKTPRAYEFLKWQFRERRVLKTYRVIVWGALEEISGAITRPIGRSKTDFRKRAVVKEESGGRDARTRFRVLRRLKDVTHMEAYPETGRTHQIRVHFTSRGNPVVCDRLYAAQRDCPAELGRLALHALRVEFELSGGRRIALEAEEPAEFAHFLATREAL